MKRFTDSIRLAVTSNNWLSALSLSLMMPDICGGLETPELKNYARYVPWFDRHVQPKYTTLLGPNKEAHVFLSGEDCYLLRCGFLHEGTNDISTNKYKKTIDSFQFVTPPPIGSRIHMNYIFGKLQLQIDIFSLDIANSVDDWSDLIKEDQDIQERIKNLLAVHNSDLGVRI